MYFLIALFVSFIVYNFIVGFKQGTQQVKDQNALFIKQNPLGEPMGIEEQFKIIKS